MPSSPSHRTPASRPRRGGRGRLLLIVLLAVLAAVAAWVHTRPDEHYRPPPPRLTADDIRAAADDEVRDKATSDLRWLLVNLSPEQQATWRTLPAPARHVLALAPMEHDPEHPPALFEGFAAVLADTRPASPRLDDIVAAYAAIGATASATVVEEARRVAATASRTPAAFAALDQRMHALIASRAAVRCLRAYIRANAETLATAHLGATAGDPP